MTSQRRASSAAACQSVVWPLPLTGPSNSTRPGSTQARVDRRPHHRQHAQRARQVRARRCRRCRSAGCRAGSHAGSRRSRSRVGWRVTATQASLSRAGAASSLARCVVTWRTEVANTKPMASTSQASAVSHGHRRGHAADLDEGQRGTHALACDLRARAATAARACASMARASSAGSAADMSALPTSARS